MRKSAQSGVGYFFCLAVSAVKQKGAASVDIKVGDVLIMKKSHPCGENKFQVLRIGMDFKIKCLSCGHEVMLPRVKCEKNIKKIITQTEGK